MLSVYIHKRDDTAPYDTNMDQNHWLLMQCTTDWLWCTATSEARYEASETPYQAKHNITKTVQTVTTPTFCSTTHYTLTNASSFLQVLIIHDTSLDRNKTRWTAVQSACLPITLFMDFSMENYHPVTNKYISRCIWNSMTKQFFDLLITMQGQWV